MLPARLSVRISQSWSELYPNDLILRIGVEPRYMGIAPVAAIPKVLAMTGLFKEDVDVWEVRYPIILCGLH